MMPVVKPCHVFCRLLEERLKAMLTSLPLVSDLHHPAMRERHWKQLMKVFCTPNPDVLLLLYYRSALPEQLQRGPAHLPKWSNCILLGPSLQTRV